MPAGLSHLPNLMQRRQRRKFFNSGSPLPQAEWTVVVLGLLPHTGSSLGLQQHLASRPIPAGLQEQLGQVRAGLRSSGEAVLEP